MSWWHRHPVLTNAAGGVIATGVAAGFAQFKGWIDLPAWQWIIAATPTLHWLLIIMGLAVIGWLAVLAALLIRNREEAQQTFNVLAYDNDEFFGMRWRWRWAEGVGPYNLVPFCLKCDMQIDPGLRGGGYAAVAELIFPCKLCREVQYEVGAGDTRLEDVQRDVLLLIQRNVRQRLAKQQQEQSANGK